MAAGFQYFTSSDSGAPALYGAAGRMIAVLDWVLVTKGGWQKPFSNTNLAAYRSDSGNRFYLKVDDTQAQSARMRGYRAMTSITAGTNPFPSTTQIAINDYVAWKSDTADTNPRKYFGVRTNRYVVLIMETSIRAAGSATQPSIFVFGDVPSYVSGDSFNTIISSGDINAGSYSVTSYIQPSQAYGSGTITGGMQTAVAATPTGSVASPLVGGLVYSGFAGTSFSGDGDGFNPGFIPRMPKLLFAQTATTPGTAPAYLRFRVPNTHIALCPLNTPNAVALSTQVEGSRSFLVVPEYYYFDSTDGSTTIAFSGSARASILLETTDTDGAL